MNKNDLEFKIDEILKKIQNFIEQKSKISQIKIQNFRNKSHQIT